MDSRTLRLPKPADSRDRDPMFICGYCTEYARASRRRALAGTFIQRRSRTLPESRRVSRTIEWIRAVRLPSALIVRRSSRRTAASLPITATEAVTRRATGTTAVTAAATRREAAGSIRREVTGIIPATTTGRPIRATAVTADRAVTEYRSSSGKGTKTARDRWWSRAGVKPGPTPAAAGGVSQTQVMTPAA